MQIQEYELYEVPPRWLFLKLGTRSGVTGWGEPVVEGRVKSVRAAVEELIESYILGKDAQRIEDHWQAMYRGGFYRGGPILMSAIAGIDQALWDIKGKQADLPIYQLLGGKSRDRIRVYQWVGGDRPEETVDEAERLIDRGYSTLKVDATVQLRHIDTPAKVEEIVERIRYLRESVGSDIDICVDFRGRVAKPMSKRLVSALESFDLMFIEEPISPEHNHLLGEISAQTTTPLATGERLYTRWDARPVFEDGIIDVFQPDISHAGGISEVRRVASMAAAYDMAIAPNCPLGPVALAASLQVSTHVPNLLVQDHGFETWTDGIGSSYQYLRGTDHFEFEDGYVMPPSSPGLGIDVDETAIERAAEQDIDWESPLWRHPDGSVAEW